MAEYEVRFLKWDQRAVLARARSLGAPLHPQTVLLDNAVYTLPESRKGIVRIRRQAAAPPAVSHATLTCKVPDAKSRFDIENETGISDPEETHAIVTTLGCVPRMATQKLRDIYEVPGLGRLDVDSHPGLPPILEVESPSKPKLDKLLRALRLDKDVPPASVSPPSPEGLYQEIYGIKDARKRFAEKRCTLTFARGGDVARYAKRNKELFDQTLARQRNAVAVILANEKSTSSSS